MQGVGPRGGLVGLLGVDVGGHQAERLGVLGQGDRTRRERYRFYAAALLDYERQNASLASYKIVLGNELGIPVGFCY